MLRKKWILLNVFFFFTSKSSLVLLHRKREWKKKLFSSSKHILIIWQCIGRQYPLSMFCRIRVCLLSLVVVVVVIVLGWFRLIWTVFVVVLIVAGSHMSYFYGCNTHLIYSFKLNQPSCSFFFCFPTHVNPVSETWKPL